MREIRILIYCWWGHKMAQLLWKTIWLFLKKSNMKSTIWHNSIPTYIPKALKTGAQTKTCTRVCTTAQFAIAERQRRARCPSAEGWWHIKVRPLCCQKEQSSNTCYSTDYIRLKDGASHRKPSIKASVTKRPVDPSLWCTRTTRGQTLNSGAAP